MIVYVTGGWDHNVAVCAVVLGVIMWQCVQQAGGIIMWLCVQQAGGIIMWQCV